MTEKKQFNKKALLGVGILVVVIAALAVVYSMFGAKPVAGSKSITIEVVNKAQESIIYELTTDAEYLEQAMEEAEGLEFTATDGQYGKAVDSINGEKADFNTDSAYWAFSVNGEYCNYGISEQPVMDGDDFTITYTTF